MDTEFGVASNVRGLAAPLRLIAWSRPSLAVVGYLGIGSGFEFDTLRITALKPGLQRLLPTRYRMSMTVEAIKEEIGHLSEEERKQLLGWLEELEEEAWDREMEHDFSAAGPGSHLAEKIERDRPRDRFTRHYVT